ncbi:hypothetical protein dsx2_2980 [Desulfovibrio sp. X2]|uniref:hypothetical protein n=1 Tax=Desulfovibrio sp. X2 TaxID=941449 RepID=UPI000358D866|nr:hypothetical protein [Desulfovibrio sp. X2]EPR41814.1 hypothetical protein dsx2_2980 [Desulfovibrio sp. X2]
MRVFKDEAATKRVIFNVRLDLAERLEKAKEEARLLGRKLDFEATIDKALEKFLKKAERRIEELKCGLGDDARAPGRALPPEDETDGEGGTVLD